MAEVSLVRDVFINIASTNGGWAGMTMNLRISGVAAALSVACMMTTVNCALAQTPTVPRPADLTAKPEAPVTDAAALPARSDTKLRPRQLGKPSEDVEIDVASYAVDDDAPAELRSALARITAPYVGKGRHYEDLVDAAADVGRFLQRDLGYYLGYAYIPEQAPNGAVIRIAILEGRLDHVDLQWVDGLPVKRDVVQAYLDRLVPGEVLKVRDVERVVFLINDLRGINAVFEVKPGSRPGTATLVVKPKAEKILSYRAEADVNGSRYLGTERLGGLVAYNSPLGRGDVLTANALISAKAGLMFGLLGYTTPIGGSGLKAGMSLSSIAYHIDEAAVAQQVYKGSAVSATAYLLYPWVRARNLNLFVLGSAEQKQYEDIANEASTRKRTSSFTLGTTGDFRDSLLTGGVNTFEFNATAGNLQYPGGVPPGSDVPLSYSKAAGAVTRLQNIVNGRLLLYVAARAQLALTNLDNTEQFRLGGPDGVRAFSPGEGTGDDGGLLSAELRLLPPEEWLGRYARETVFSFFYDLGWVQLRHDPPKVNPSPIRSASFSGVGAGVTWVRPDKYSLRINLAHPVSGVPKADPKVTNLRLYSQFSLFF
jgi:hemolysin activation/secretion protein